VAPPSELKRLAAEADVLALTCPLTPETEGVINAEVIGAMKRSAYLVNVARGRVVDEVALTTALRHGRLAGAGLDCFHTEPMDPASPLWTLPNVIVTPHSAGETQHYERNVVRLLLTNLQALGTKRDFTNLVI
jgi:phosphoglycerate dehydrogenase-like enzyme